MRLREFRRHVPGQQILDASEGMIGDAGKYFAQPAFRIEVVEACGSQQRMDGGRALTASVRSAKQIVLAAQGNGAKRPLGRRVIDLDVAVAGRRSTAVWKTSDAQWLRQLEEENRKLKQLVAEQALDIVGFKAVLSKKW